jgi:hypothetical protein
MNSKRKEIEYVNHINHLPEEVYTFILEFILNKTTKGPDCSWSLLFVNKSWSSIYLNYVTHFIETVIMSTIEKFCSYIEKVLQPSIINCSNHILDETFRQTFISNLKWLYPLLYDNDYIYNISNHKKKLCISDKFYEYMICYKKSDIISEKLKKFYYLKWCLYDHICMTCHILRIDNILINNMITFGPINIRHTSDITDVDTDFSTKNITAFQSKIFRLVSRKSFEKCKYIESL